MRVNATLVVNSKGGSGKTTITTNLASYFATQDIPTTVMDYDPQGSSLHWLRARTCMPVYQPLERFLNSLGLPFLTRISDSDAYVKAAEAGIGIFEMDPSAAAAECAQFMPIIEWVGSQRDPAASGDGKVIDLASRRWTERTPGLSSIGSRS